jgi:hypothetical protein
MITLMATAVSAAVSGAARPSEEQGRIDIGHIVTAARRHLRPLCEGIMVPKEPPVREMSALAPAVWVDMLKLTPPSVVEQAFVAAVLDATALHDRMYGISDTGHSLIQSAREAGLSWIRAVTLIPTTQEIPKEFWQLGFRIAELLLLQFVLSRGGTEAISPAVSKIATCRTNHEYDYPAILSATKAKESKKELNAKNERRKGGSFRSN